MNNNVGGEGDNLPTELGDENIKNAILFQNVRSLTANYNKLVHDLSLLKESPIVIAMQETWKPKHTHTKMIGFHNLINIARPKNKRGGGVGFFINNNYDYQTINVTQSEHLEQACTYISNINSYILNIYRPPRGDIPTFITQLKETIKTIKTSARAKNSDLIIGGDININILDSTNNNTTLLQDLTEEELLIPQISKPTRFAESTATCIDIILTNSKKIISANSLNTDISDHLGTYISLNTKKIKQEKAAPPEYIFNEKNTNILTQLLQAEKWEEVLNTNTNDTFGIFRRKMESYIKLACTNNNKKGSNRNKNTQPGAPWMTIGLLRSRTQKNQLYKEHMKKGTAQTYHQFKTYQKMYYKIIKKAKTTHINQELEKHSGDGRKIWEAINKHTNRITKNTPPIRNINTENGETTQPAQIANAFNNFFAEIGENLAKKLVIPKDKYKEYLPKTTIPKLVFQPITQEQLTKIIKGMKNKTSCGHDHMSNKLLKNIYPAIHKPLLHIINTSITNKFVPAWWKKAKIVPLHYTRKVAQKK